MKQSMSMNGLDTVVKQQTLFGRSPGNISNSSISSAVSTPAPKNDVKPQMDSLHALFRSTNGSSWRSFRNWGQTAQKGKFINCFGVEVDDNNNILEIRLLMNDLDGILPPEFCSLPFLSYLDLSNNKIGGRLPENLDKLHSLRELKLHYNKLTGCIPDCIGNILSLRGVHFESNGLSGPIPSSIGNLKHLIKINLGLCEFSGPIPASLGQLLNLQELKLHGNKLSGSIPSCLGELSQLRVLTLQDNKLTGLIPTSLANLPHLSKLWLSNNKLSGRVPAAFKKCRKLNLRCENNEITGPLTITALNNQFTLCFYTTCLLVLVSIPLLALFITIRLPILPKLFGVCLPHHVLTSTSTFSFPTSSFALPGTTVTSSGGRSVAGIRHDCMELYLDSSLFWPMVDSAVVDSVAAAVQQQRATAPYIITSRLSKISLRHNTLIDVQCARRLIEAVQLARISPLGDLVGSTVSYISLEGVLQISDTDQQLLRAMSSPELIIDLGPIAPAIVCVSNATTGADNCVQESDLILDSDTLWLRITMRIAGQVWSNSVLIWRKLFQVAIEQFIRLLKVLQLAVEKQQHSMASSSSSLALTPIHHFLRDKCDIPLFVQSPGLPHAHAHADVGVSLVMALTALGVEQPRDLLLLQPSDINQLPAAVSVIKRRKLAACVCALWQNHTTTATATSTSSADPTTTKPPHILCTMTD